MDNNTSKILEEMLSTPEGLDKLIEAAEKMKEKKEIATDQQEERYKKEIKSKDLIEVSDKLFNVVTDLEILEEVDNKLAGPGGDERLAEIMTFDYLKKAKKEAIETYELVNKIGNLK